MTGPLDLSAFTAPATVAVIGASRDPAKMGGAAVRNLRHFGYPGRIFAVNAGRSGDPALDEYVSLTDCPQRPDAVVVAVPAEPAMAVVKEALRMEVPAVILVSAGFGEAAAGSEGARRARELDDLVAGSATRILGPNTTGLADFRHRFVPRAVLNSPDDIRPGPVAVISQSGALSNTLMARLHAQGLGIGLVVATGDETDLRTDHWLRAVARRDDLHTVVWVVEGIRDGEATRAALEALWRADKRLIVLHMGGSEAGQAVAATHTGALAADADVVRALCQRYGAVWADGINDVSRLAVLAPAVDRSTRGPGQPLRVQLVCGSGGEAALLTDAYSAEGIELPPPSATFDAFVRDNFSFALAANPFDLTGQTLSAPGLLVRTIGQAVREDVDLIHVALPVFRDELGERLYAGLDATLGDDQRPVVASLWTCPGLTDESWRTWHRTPAAVLDGSDGVPSALRRLAAAQDAARIEASDPDAALSAGNVSAGLPAAALDGVAASLERHGIVTTDDARDLAPALGLAVPECVAAAAFAARPRSGTFFVKGYEAGAVHKQRAGLVLGPLSTPDLVVAALTDGATRRPDARWYAEQAVEASIGLMVSIRRDRLLGWAGLIGVGGGLTELFADAVVTVLPVHTPEHVLAEVRQGRLGAYLAASDGDPVVIEATLRRIVTGVLMGAAAIAARFAVVELNPVLVDGRTGAAWCVDFVAQS